MRGKKPKERKNYILRTENETLVEVTREVYLEWYQSRRREKYQQEQKYGVCSLDVVQEGSFAKTSISQEGQPVEMAGRSECLNNLKESLDQFSEQEAYLIYLLFFEEVTVKEAAQICGCSRKTIQNRKKRILKTLKNIMKELGIEGGCIYFN